MIGDKILKYKTISFGLSIFFVVISLFCVAFKGVPRSVEFVGGTLIEIKSSNPINLDIFNEKLSAEIKNIDKKLTFSSQITEDTFITIRFPLTENISKLELIKDLIAVALGSERFTFERIDNIGPQVSQEIAKQSVMAILFAFMAIAVYMSIRFNKHFAISGVLVLVQDVIISAGFISFFKLEFDLTMMAAFLTIIGYCINDTVVIYDRIRYNLINNLSKTVSFCIGLGIQQTIKRSIITSVVTLLAVFGILFFHNESIRNFGIVVGFGIIIGTFGSIFVASVLPIMIGLKPYKIKEDKVIDPLFYTS
jgi:preprotein translocase subunit SecF